MELIKKINSIKTNNELLDYKAKIDEAFKKRQEFITLCEVANDNSTKDFGYIKEAFETISPMIFNKKGGKNILKKYTKTINESKNLSALHTLYENIRKANGNADVDFFINSIASSEWNVNENITSDTLKLGRVLAEGILLVGQDAVSALPEENKTLNEAVKFLSENKRTNKNIAEYSDAMRILREHIKNNDKPNMFESVNIDSFANKLIESFNKKYENLSEEEIEIIKSVNINENKEDIFNKYKTECLNKISTYMNNDKNDDVNKVSEVYNKIKNKTFVLENVGTDICGFVEITKLFE